jgi:hypothetical protein
MKTEQILLFFKVNTAKTTKKEVPAYTPEIMTNLKKVKKICEQANCDIFPVSRSYFTYKDHCSIIYIYFMLNYPFHVM